MFGVELVVMLLMIAINSVFAGYELALASVSEMYLQRQAQERRTGARAALRMKQKMEASLAVVQLGITLVGAIAAATGGAGAEQFIEPVLRGWGLSKAMAQFFAIAVVVLPLTVVTIVFGELVPKVFSLRNKEWVCLRLSPAMEWFAMCVWPAVWVLEKSVSSIMSWSEKRWKSRGAHLQSEEAALQELRAVASVARASRLIGVHEERIIHNAARLSSLPVQSIMLPAEYISMIYIEDTLSEALIAAHHDMHTRFPVTEKKEDPQSIVGYVNFKDIVACLHLTPQEASLRGITRPLASLGEGQTVAECLEILIRDRVHIALVRDSAGQVTGLVTLEDMLEELVGEIHDEFDRLPTHISRAGKGWIVGGGVKLTRLAELSGVTLTKEGNLGAVLNDWVIERLAAPVDGGETIVSDGVRVLVRKERRQSVQEAYIEQLPRES